MQSCSVLLKSLCSSLYTNFELNSCPMVKGSSIHHHSSILNQSLAVDVLEGGGTISSTTVWLRPPTMSYCQANRSKSGWVFSFLESLFKIKCYENQMTHLLDNGRHPLFAFASNEMIMSELGPRNAFLFFPCHMHMHVWDHLELTLVMVQKIYWRLINIHFDRLHIYSTNRGSETDLRALEFRLRC